MTSDDELMEQLRRIAGELDAVPELVTESAQAAFSTRRLDDELAELLYDSYAGTAADVRGVQAGPRLLSFGDGDVSLELQIETVDGRLAVHGVATGTIGDATVEAAGTGRYAAAVDEQGWFRVDGLPVGPLRVRVQAPNDATITTSWIRP